VKIIVTDTQYRKAFDTTNAIRHYGYEVVPTVSVSSCWQSWKLKFAFPEKVWLLRTESIDLFCNDLKRIVVEDESLDFVSGCAEFGLVACEEKTVELLAQSCDFLTDLGVKALLPSFDAFRKVVDKGDLMELCDKIGICIPKSCVDVDRFVPFIENSSTIDWVVKPRRGTGAEGVVYFKKQNLGEFSHRFVSGNVVQEKIPSEKGVLGGFFLCSKGKVISHYAHERIRTYPDSGGVTVLSKCIRNDDLRAIGENLFSALEWDGFAMIECIRDSRDGELKVIEVNPRLWGSILLSEFSGARLVLNYLRILDGKDVISQAPDPNSFIRWIFPYDVFYWLTHPGERKGFFKTNKQTCYVCRTYTSALRSWMFQLMNVVDPGNVLKFFRRKFARA